MLGSVSHQVPTAKAPVVSSQEIPFVRSSGHLAEIQEGSSSTSRLQQHEFPQNPVDWKAVNDLPAATSFELPREHFSVGFIKLDGQKQELNEKLLSTFNRILDLSPREYQAELKSYERALNFYEQRVDGYMADQDKKAESDYARAADAYKKAGQLLKAEQKNLLSFEKPSFRHLNTSELPSTESVSLAAQAEEQADVSPKESKEKLSFRQAKWNLHVHYDQLLKAETEFNNAKSALTEYETSGNEYSKIADKAKRTINEFQELVSTAKELEIQARLVVFEDSVIKPTEHTSVIEADAAALSQRVEDFSKNEQAEIKDGLHGTGKAATKAFDLSKAKEDEITHPELTSKNQSFFEDQHLAELKSELKSVNSQIEKGKRDEGSMSFKWARIKHQVVTTRAYKQHDSDTPELRQDKETYGDIQKKIGEVKTGIKLRQTADTALEQLLKSASVVKKDIDNLRAQIATSEEV